MYYYVYIPGLGDEKTIDWQIKAVRYWNSVKRQAMVVNPQWHNKHETYDQKVERVAQEVKNYVSGKNGKFCVVGSSAGGSMAIIIHEKLQLDAAVLIAGKLKTPGTIGHSYAAIAPALHDSVVHSQNVIEMLSGDRKNTILTISPFVDEVISKNDMIISGVKSIKLNVPGHAISIGYMLLSGKKKIFKWFESV